MLVFVSAWSGWSAAADQPAYLSELLRQAEMNRLHRHPGWLALIHYQKTSGGFVSQIDDPDFFLSKSGKSGPARELQATLQAFFSSTPVHGSELAAQCRYPARFEWLDRHLKFDPARLPTRACADLEQLLAFLQPQSLSLVFAFNYPNNPSSTFGHTLLKINKLGRSSQTGVLDYSLSFTADTGGVSNWMLYAFKGVFGGFKGKYGFLPYYAKLKQYAEMDNRDLWEYELNLDRQQINFVLKHAYELLPVYSNYYFFKENCAYFLLSLLDVVYPNHPPTQEMHWVTVPINTVKLLEKRGRISSYRFQPSLARRIRFQMDHIAANHRTLVRRFYAEGVDSVEKDLQRMAPAEKASLLDLLILLEQYRQQQKNDSLASHINNTERRLLQWRSRIDIDSEPLVVPEPNARPDFGHDTARFSVGGTYTDQRFHTEIQWRPTYHDLLDPAEGFSDFSGVQMGTIKLRLDRKSNKLRLQALNVLDLISLVPRNYVFNHVSWHLRLSHLRKQDQLDRWRRVSEFYGGAGLSRRTGSHSLIFTTAVTAFRSSRMFERDYQWLAGARAGWIGEPLPRLRILLQADTLHPLSGDPHRNHRASLGLGWATGSQSSIRLQLRQERFENRDRQATTLNFHLHF